MHVKTLLIHASVILFSFESECVIIFCVPIHPIFFIILCPQLSTWQIVLINNEKLELLSLHKSHKMLKQFFHSVQCLFHL